MEKIEIKKEDIKVHNIVIALTSKPDYDMTRYYLLEDVVYDSNLKLKYDEYIVADGFHCSCYDFDDTEWEFIKYTKEELLKIADDRINNDYWYVEEKEFYKLVKNYLS